MDIKEIEKELKDKQRMPLLNLHCRKRILVLLSYIKELEEILKRFQDEHCDAVNALGIYWKADDSLCVAIERLVKRTKKLEEGLGSAIGELECSGYDFDHPSLVRLRKLIEKEKGNILPPINTTGGQGSGPI